MDCRIICQIGGCFVYRFFETARHVDMKLAQNFGLSEIMTSIREALAVRSDEPRQYMGFAIQIRQSHQMKAVLSRPTKTILTARATHPDRRMRSLHRLGEDGNIVDIIVLAFEVDRFIGPGLPNDFHSFVHAPGGFSLVDAEFFVFMRFTAFSYAEIQAAVGNNIRHRVGLRHIERVV